jgi:hypothetical protein
MTSAHTQYFIQSQTAFLPLPQLILIPVGLASIVSYFLERRAVVAEQATRKDPIPGPRLVPHGVPSSRGRRTIAIGFVTALVVILVVGASMFVQFKREQVLARELRALEPYPGVIVMDTSFERAWLLSNKTAVRSEYSTTAGYLAISEYYQALFQKQGWNSLPVQAELREARFCKGQYEARLEYPEQKLDPGYLYALEIRVDGCS